MQEFVLSNLDIYGPIAVFALLMLSGFGIPLGEDFVVIPAGILIARGEFPLVATMLSAYFGVVIADFLWFWIISRYGTLLLHKRGFRRMVHPRRLLQAKHQLDRHGAWMIVFARFIPGSRASAITVAGMLHMPFWKFALATASCVLLTVPLQLGLGMLIEKGLGTEDTAQTFLRLFGLVMLLLAVLLFWKMYRNYRASRKGAPRARAAWLRRFRLPRLKRKISKTGDDLDERTTTNQSR
ncbi:MAG: DedA family protein [Planctomycetes bacterium]|nr:DedA family protein [Planctomycetota bacterium]